VAEALACLLSKCEVLSSNLKTIKKKEFPLIFKKIFGFTPVTINISLPSLLEEQRYISVRVHRAGS
jgi:hypothetical protein